MNLILAVPDSRDLLEDELSRLDPLQGGLESLDEVAPGLFQATADMSGGLPRLAFARQIAPNAQPVQAASIQAWARLLVDAVVGTVPDGTPWSLHVYGFVPAREARGGARAWHTQSRARQPGDRARRSLPSAAPRPPSAVAPARCGFIREAVIELLRKRRRHLLRSLSHDARPFLERETLVQLVLTSSERGFLSLTPAPFPFAQRHAISFFPGGIAPIATDKEPPSRAFTKLIEAEARMGRSIAASETCVDLGASPGSWTYVGVQRGAHVTAVDRSDLRADLMRHPHVGFQRGDAFRFEPEGRVDWLLCDVIARAERSAELLSRWLRERWCRHFVVTLKMDDAESGVALARLKRELHERSDDFWVLRLCANKKEVCAFGSAE